MDRNCDHCGTSYVAKQSNSKFCGSAECRRDRERARARRKRSGLKAEVVPFPVPTPDGEPCGPLEQAARDELTGCDRADSFAGRLALGLARRMDASRQDSGSSFSSLSKELRAAMAEATKDAPQDADAVDELKARRLARHA